MGKDFLFLTIPQLLVHEKQECKKGTGPGRNACIEGRGKI
jgi:hypothetical protein